MTAEQELQTIGECIRTLAESLPQAEAIGADTAYLRVLLDRLFREAQSIEKRL